MKIKVICQNCFEVVHITLKPFGVWIIGFCPRCLDLAYVKRRNRDGEMLEVREVLGGKKQSHKKTDIHD